MLESFITDFRWKQIEQELQTNRKSKQKYLNNQFTESFKKTLEKRKKRNGVDFTFDFNRQKVIASSIILSAAEDRFYKDLQMYSNYDKEHLKAQIDLLKNYEEGKITLEEIPATEEFRGMRNAIILNGPDSKTFTDMLSICLEQANEKWIKADLDTVDTEQAAESMIADIGKTVILEDNKLGSAEQQLADRLTNYVSASTGEKIDKNEVLDNLKNGDLDKVLNMNGVNGANAEVKDIFTDYLASKTGDLVQTVAENKGKEIYNLEIKNIENIDEKDLAVQKEQDSWSCINSIALPCDLTSVMSPINLDNLTNQIQNTDFSNVFEKAPSLTDLYSVPNQEQELEIETEQETLMESSAMELPSHS